MRDLRRTPGAISTFHLSESAGEEITFGLCVVPADRVITAEGTMESVGDGVLVSGSCRVDIDVQCSRCLTAFSHESEAEFVQLFVYENQEIDYQDEDVLSIKDDSVDLEPVIRDALILNQPLAPLCQPECRGLCLRCGASLNEDRQHHHVEETDSRWSSLAQWSSMS